MQTMRNTILETTLEVARSAPKIAQTSKRCVNTDTQGLRVNFVQEQVNIFIDCSLLFWNLSNCRNWWIQTTSFCRTLSDIVFNKAMSFPIIIVFQHILKMSDFAQSVLVV